MKDDRIERAMEYVEQNKGKPMLQLAEELKMNTAVLIKLWDKHCHEKRIKA